jgi:hypothetical protein
MSLMTQLANELGWFELFNQEARSFYDIQTRLSFLPCYIASLFLFYFLCFIMNLFVTRRSRRSLVLYIRVSILKHPILTIPPPSQTVR